MSKRTKIFSIVTIIIIILLSSIIAFANSNGVGVGKEAILSIAGIIKENSVDKSNGDVIAKANELNIYQNEVEMYKKLYTIDGTLVNGSYKDVIKRRAKLKVLYNMAEEGGYAISLEEAKRLALDEKVIYDQNLDQKGKDFMKDYIAALGISEDQYWTDYYPNQVQLYYSIEKLKSSFIDDAVKKGIVKQLINDGSVLNGDNEIIKQQKLYLSKKINEIESSIQIKILNDKYNK